jgi:hypothetical protein
VETPGLTLTILTQTRPKASPIYKNIRQKYLAPGVRQNPGRDEFSGAYPKIHI